MVNPIFVPAVLNPIVGRFASRYGPRWWNFEAFAICGAAMVSFGNLASQSQKDGILFVTYLAVLGIALAVLVAANNIAISVASLVRTQAQEDNVDLGSVLSRLSPGVMLSGLTTAWAAGMLLGPGYSSLISYTEDVGRSIFCCSIGGICFVASLGSMFL
jgi:MFS family permease